MGMFSRTLHAQHPVTTNLHISPRFSPTIFYRETRLTIEGGRVSFGDLPGDEIVVSPPSPIVEPLAMQIRYSYQHTFVQ